MSGSLVEKNGEHFLKNGEYFRIGQWVTATKKMSLLSVACFRILLEIV